MCVQTASLLREWAERAQGVLLGLCGSWVTRRAAVRFTLLRIGTPRIGSRAEDGKGRVRGAKT